MTEAVHQSSNRRYYAVAAHGFSENFEEEPNFPIIPSSVASGGTAPVVIDYPRVSGVVAGVRKRYIVKYTGTSVKPFEIAPETLVTSKALGTPVTFGQAGSMATQQPPTTEDETVEEIIWRAGTTLSIRYRERLASRLNELQTAVQEEEPDGRGITVKSLQQFIEFLKAHPALRCPSITATPERNIYASWKSEPDRVFSIHFLPDCKVRFVIFYPNDKHKEEMIRLSGTATADIIMSIATPHGVLSWVSDERPGNPRF